MIPLALFLLIFSAAFCLMLHALTRPIVWFAEWLFDPDPPPARPRPKQPRKTRP